MRLVLPELQDSCSRNRFLALHGPWIVLVIGCGVIATIFSVVTSQDAGLSPGPGYELFYCDPRDRVRYTYEETFDRTSPYWDTNLFLSVTMGFSGLTFSQAKAIDIFFDLVIGRGSQLLVALAAYPLLRRAVLRSMEVREFSLALVLPFFIERLSAFTLWAMLTNMRVTRKKDSSSDARIARPSVRMDWRIVLVVLVGCYILSIPTFLSAMTSYQTRGEPFFPVDGDSNYMSADDVKYPNAFVSYGDQLGLDISEGSTVVFPLYNATDPELYAACVGYYKAKHGQVAELWRQNWLSFKRAYPFASVTPYAYTDDPSLLDGARTDDFMEAELAFNKTRDSLPLRQSITDEHKPPRWSFTLWPRNVTLGNILYPMHDAVFMNSAIHVRNTTYNLENSIDLDTNFIYRAYYHRNESEPDLLSRFDYPPDPDSTTLFAVKDGDTMLYRGFELAADGKCLPSKDYVWGFSSLMLFTFCMLTILILLLLIVLHYDASCNSMADRYKLRTSAFRDVLDLAEELRAHYGEAEVASMSAPELDKCMQTDPAMSGLETATLRNPRAARWKQGSLRLRVPTWGKWRKSSGERGSSTSDAEESLMSIGFDKHESGFGQGKMPSKAVTRQST